MISVSLDTEDCGVMAAENAALLIRMKYILK